MMIEHLANNQVRLTDDFDHERVLMTTEGPGLDQTILDFFAQTVRPVPEQVDHLRAKLALGGAGLYPTVDAFMARPDTPIAYKIYWNEADIWHRSSPIINNLAATFGWSQELLDQLFVAAETMEV